MCILFLLDGPAAAHPDCPAVGEGDASLSYADVASLAARGGSLIGERGATHVAYLGADAPPQVVVALFAAAAADVPFVPLDARLPFDLLRNRLAALAAPLVIADDVHIDAARAAGHDVIAVSRFLVEVGSVEPIHIPPCCDDLGTAAIFFAEDERSERGEAVRHRDLVSPVLTTLDLVAVETHDAGSDLAAHHQRDGIVQRLANIHAGRPIVLVSPVDSRPALVGAADSTEPTTSSAHR